ncbi:hypothetical protein LEMLEM_LOCUS24409 [Lemmus lemmus]
MRSYGVRGFISLVSSHKAKLSSTFLTFYLNTREGVVQTHLDTKEGVVLPVFLISSCLFSWSPDV